MEIFRYNPLIIPLRGLPLLARKEVTLEIFDLMISNLV
jgi:hypothetical protein